MNKKKLITFCFFIAVLTVFFLFNISSVSAASVTVDLEGVDTPQNTADTVKILMILTVISLAPSILVLVTGFTRIIIVLSFVRNALGLQQTPPNQVLIGLALFLTVFLMYPIFTEINEQAFQPYINETITQEEAMDRAILPIKTFMLKQFTKDNESDLLLFMEIADHPPVDDLIDIKLEVVIPAFITSELKKAFTIGFFIFIPFLIIDLVVSSTLMSLGMMMLPPAMVSMPFKLILFLIVDGWNLIIQVLIGSF